MCRARHGFDPDLLAQTVQKLIKEEVVVGKLHGGAFTPKGYTDFEAKKVDSAWDFRSKIHGDPWRFTVESTGLQVVIMAESGHFACLRSSLAL